MCCQILSGSWPSYESRYLQHICRKAGRDYQKWYATQIFPYCRQFVLIQIHLDQCLNPPQLAFSPEVQETYVKAWKSIDPDVGGVSIEPTIEGALNLARKLGDQDSNGMQTLITGSLYLVGGALSFLQPNPPDLAEE